MLSILDRRIRLWHVIVADIVALAWFVGMNLATLSALPGAKLFRCPIGLCPGYYSPSELNTTLTVIGKNGRDFFAQDAAAARHGAAGAGAGRPLHHLPVAQPAGPSGVDTARPPGARYALLAVPVLYSMADYAENWALVEAVQAYPNIPYRLARRASVLTATKSQLIVASVGIAWPC